MALTPLRWIALALIGFAIVHAVVFREDDRPDRSATARDRLTARLRLARVRAESAADQLRRAVIHDSIQRVARVSTERVSVDRAIESDLRLSLEPLVASAAASAAPRIPVRVHFVLDTVRVVRGHPRRDFGGALAMDYLLPRDSATACVAIARVKPRQGESSNPRRAAAELRSPISRERLLGPCAYLAQFGQPGARIRAWLDAGGWTYAQRGQFGAATGGVTPPEWALRYRGQLDLLDFLPAAAVRCAGGSGSACLQGLMEPRPTGWAVAEHRVISTNDYNPFYHGYYPWFSRRQPFGALEWTLISDMVRTIGPERFAAFWRSDLEPADAFRQATGGELADWVQQWVVHTYGPYRAGPALAGADVGTGLLLLALAATLAVGVARRRAAT